uniref:Cilia- and flagella-associated protein 52 n=1 Tax=Culicoides sonorensis TaxID=179676 RepID=A0A336M2Q3_CULSO
MLNCTDLACVLHHHHFYAHLHHLKHHLSDDHHDSVDYHHETQSEAPPTGYHVESNDEASIQSLLNDTVISSANNNKQLEPVAIFGFDGNVPNGLRVHPDGIHLIFPLGNKVAILNFHTDKEDFLCGHTHTVSCLNISNSGKKIVSGQVNHMGYRAYVIVWNWETRQEILRHELHKVRIESVCFTSNETYVISLGGRDCGTVVVWNVEKNAPFCGAQSSKETTGHASRLCSLGNRSCVFVTGGEQNLRLWCIDIDKKRLFVHDVQMGKLGRDFTSIKIDENDEMMYVGTMSGDVVKVRLNCHENPDVIDREKAPVLLGCYGRHNPRKPPGKDCEKYNNGVRDLLLLAPGYLLIGAGDGQIELVEERNCSFKNYKNPTWPQFKTIRRTRVSGPISSLQLMTPDMALVGTKSCEIYSLCLKDFNLKFNFSLVFATASYESIRVWSVTKFQELLRIVVHNFQAASVLFSRDGKSIVSAWNDGVIRAFTPLTGKLIYAIPNAHNKGCSSIVMTSNCKILVSGGIEGQVRVWRIEPMNQRLIGVLKEHYAPITSIAINSFDSEIVSASSDGSCIIWDLVRLQRRHVLFAHTQFNCATFLPNAVQVLTAGSDKSISYWEVYDGTQVREIQGSKTGPVNFIDIDSSGDQFVSCGDDQIVRLWDYQKGEELCNGVGHAGVVTVCKYAPNGKFIVSGSFDGGVFIWKIPDEFQKCETIPKNENAHSKKLPKSKMRPIENVTQLNSRLKTPCHICECPKVDTEKQPNIDPCVKPDDLLETCSMKSEPRSEASANKKMTERNNISQIYRNCHTWNMKKKINLDGENVLKGVLRLEFEELDHDKMTFIIKKITKIGMKWAEKGLFNGK